MALGTAQDEDSARGRAVAAYKAGDFEAAAEAYGAALAEAATGEDRASALSNRAQCYIKLRQFASAREDAAAARSLDPSLAKAWFRLGVAEAQLGNFSPAEEAFARAHSLLKTAGGDKAAWEALLDLKARTLEAKGIYPWAEVYARYLGKTLDPVHSRMSVVAPPVHDDTVIGSLSVEPFIGPLRVAASEGRGRGLFATEDVREGQLLMCAQAVATGENDQLPETIAKALLKFPDLKAAVLNLSRGSEASESELPSSALAELAAPRRLLEAEEEPRGEDDAEQKEELKKIMKEVEDILYFNQFSLPTVNANAAPIEVGNDPARSGLWLLPSFMNHSCLPNVQFIIVWDCLFVRAGRALRAGDELFACYLESLQPRERRQESLASYGIRTCSCERCFLEAAVLEASEVKQLQEKAASVLADHTLQGAARASALEDVAQSAVSFASLALETALKAGRIDGQQLHYLALPKEALAATRMAMIREGFERPSPGSEEEDYARQESLFRVLLGGLANVLRSHAISLRGLNQYVDQTQSWERVASVLSEVIPGSELAALVFTEVLSARLLATHLDYRGAARGALKNCLKHHHHAYGGALESLKALESQTFAPAIFEGALELWKKEFSYPNDSYDLKNPSSWCKLPADKVPAAEPSQSPEKTSATKPAPTSGSPPSAAAAPPATSATSTSTSTSTSTFTTSANVAATPTAPSTASSTAPSTASPSVPPIGSSAASGTSSAVALPPASEGAHPSPSTSAKGGGGSGVLDEAPSYEVSEISDSHQTAEVLVKVHLPGIESASQVSLEVSDREIQLRSLPEVRSPISLEVPLPVEVEADSCVAKWSKKTRQLTLQLRPLPEKTS